MTIIDWDEEGEVIERVSGSCHPASENEKSTYSTGVDDEMMQYMRNRRDSSYPPAWDCVVNLRSTLIQPFFITRNRIRNELHLKLSHLPGALFCLVAGYALSERLDRLMLYLLWLGACSLVCLAALGRLKTFPVLKIIYSVTIILYS